MQQITALWQGLEMRRKIAVAAATLGVFLAVLGLARMASNPSMALLYAGLDSAAAGEVIQQLEARNIRYEVRGDAIHVPLTLRDETRMLLAAQSLPANGSAGYELLDGLSGFGTTSQMFDAAYWRAKEGELARTIAAAAHIRSARVHIAQGTQSPFRRELAPRASVTVGTATGTLSIAQARALRFLVASAVAGLDPDDVSVIDSSGGLIAGNEAADDPARTEGDRAARMRRNVERLLEAHLGPGRAVVELNLETVTDRETILERRFDPEGRVAVSTETEERSRTATGTQGAGVSVASNLPDGDAGAGEGGTRSQELDTRERTNFEISETKRELHRVPGAIRRLSVAVLVDGIRETAADGSTQWTPRPEAELEALRDLVASAVGFDAARGDVISLHSLPFEPVLPEGTAAPASRLDRLMPDPLTLAGLVALLLVALTLALFVLRPILRAARDPAPASAMLAAPSQGTQLSLPAVSAPDHAGDYSGEIADEDETDPAGSAGAAENRARGGTADPVERMRALIAERQAESVEILRHWMQEKERER